MWSNLRMTNVEHTAHRVPPPTSEIGRRLNYDSRKRKLFAAQPLERRKCLDFRRGCMGFDCLFKIVFLWDWRGVFYKIQLVCFEFASSLLARHHLNGQSHLRVQRILGSRCKCSSGKCFKIFKQSELMPFLVLFWSLQKTLQDAYVSCLGLFISE